MLNANTLTQHTKQYKNNYLNIQHFNNDTKQCMWSSWYSNRLTINKTKEMKIKATNFY